MALASAFLVKKNSPYTEYFNRGLLFKFTYTCHYVTEILSCIHFRLMQIDESGLIQYWTRHTESDLSHHCTRKTKMEMKNTNKNKSSKKPLTLKGLSGAFLILGVGSSLAVAAFIIELIHGYSSKNKTKPSQNKNRS